MFDEEELLRVEEEAYYEAQREAAKAASMTLSLKVRLSSVVVLKPLCVTRVVAWYALIIFSSVFSFFPIVNQASGLLDGRICVTG